MRSVLLLLFWVKEVRKKRKLIRVEENNNQELA